jgi:hypothetical protein
VPISEFNDSKMTGKMRALDILAGALVSKPP